MGRIVPPRPNVGGVAVNGVEEENTFEITKDGPRATIVKKVSGLKGDETSRLVNATRAIGVPRYGSYYPPIEGLPVSRISAAFFAGSTDTARVVVEYSYATGGDQHFANIDAVRDERKPQLEIVSSSQTTQTQLAFMQFPPMVEPAWVPIQLKYIPMLLPGQVGPIDQTPQYQGGSVEYQLPMMTFRFMRREPADAYVGDTARRFVGTINKDVIFADVQGAGGDLPHYWLCTRVEGTSDDAGKTYNTVYEFQYHPDSWDPWIIFTDPATGKPVPNPVVGESLQQVRIYKEEDFELLGLTI